MDCDPTVPYLLRLLGEQALCGLLDLDPAVPHYHGCFLLKKLGASGNVGLESNDPRSFRLGDLPPSGARDVDQRSQFVPLRKKTRVPSPLQLATGFRSSGLFLGTYWPLDLDPVVVVAFDPSCWKLEALLASCWT